MHSLNQDDCTALIVGAGGDGGRRAAEILAARGYQLLCADNDGASVRRTCNRLGAAALFVDVESTASVGIFLKHLTEQHALPQVIVNAAGQSYVRALGMVRVTLGLAAQLEERATPSLVVNIASSKDNDLIRFSGSPSGFASIAASLERQLQNSCLTLATCMSDAVDELFDALPEWHCRRGDLDVRYAS